MAEEKINKTHYCKVCDSEIKRTAHPTAFWDKWECPKCGEVSKAYVKDK